ncbi:MAG: hypothetical protein ACE5K1_11335 [Acidiferrobacterales bacterium]
MKRSVIKLLIGLLVAWPWAGLQASPLGDTFKKVRGSVVVILTEEKIVEPDSDERKRVSVKGLGSGVVISPDGQRAA